MWRPFERQYVPTLAIALAALVPFILVTSGADLFRQQVMSDARIGPTGLELASALATAGYAFGALLAGDMIQRFRKHLLFLGAEALAVVAWGAAAFATNGLLFGAALVLAGFSTGLLLVIALPPTVQQFPSSRVPVTSAFINIGLFGGVAAGPLLGGVIAAHHSWRWLYGGFSILAAVAFVLALLTLPDEEPMNPELPFDLSALLLGLGATVLPFGATAALQKGGFSTPWFLVPLGLGLLCFVALLGTEYAKEEPLAPVKKMWSTYPLVGTLVATIGGGVFVTLLRLTTTRLEQVNHLAPLASGLLFWPQILGALITAVLLGVLFRTRYVPLLVLGGMLTLIAGGLLLWLGADDDPHRVVLVAAGLLGLGAGATVSPGLFLAGFALPSNLLGRIIALIELVRSIGDFLLAPLLIELARKASGGKSLHVQGTELATEVSVMIAVAATIACLLIYLAGSRELPKPDIKRWLDDKKTAIDSPPLFARWRRGG